MSFFKHSRASCSAAQEAAATEVKGVDPAAAAEEQTEPVGAAEVAEPVKVGHYGFLMHAIIWTPLTIILQQQSVGVMLRRL